MKFARFVVLASFVCALLPGVGVRSAGADPPQIEVVPEEINSLLAMYSRAYRDHDPALLDATVGPGLIETEKKALVNASDVPFTDFRIRTTTLYSGDLATERVKARYRGRDTKTYHVIEESKIGDETDAFREDGAFTFVREPAREGFDGWRLVSKSDMAPLGFFSPHHLWDEGKVSVLKSDRFILLTHPDVAESMKPVLDIAERSYNRADDFWPGPQRDVYVMVVPSTTAELARIMHATIDLSKFVAFVAAGSDRDDGWEPTGPRMFVHLDHLRNYSEAGKLEILSHELIHAMTRDVSGPHIPTWVEEGLANLGGGSGRASLAREASVPPDFPSQERFVSGPVRQIQATYDQSQVAIELLVDEFGKEALAAFYAELGSRRLVTGTEDFHTRDAVAKSVEWTYDEWVAAWRKALS